MLKISFIVENEKFLLLCHLCFLRSPKKDNGSQVNVECKNNRGTWTDIRVWSAERIEEIETQDFICGFCAAKEIEKLKQELENLRQCVEPQHIQETKPQTPRPEKTFAEMLKRVKSEEKAQKEKETNFIVKGPVVERCETPKQVVEEILKDLGNEAQTEKVEVIKNKKQEEDSKQKRSILLVKMKDAKMKWHVIKSAIKLREKEKYKGTYINPDLTVEQRKQEFQLRADLKKKRSEDPGGKYIIKRGKIVTFRERLSQLLQNIEGMKSKYKLLTLPNPLEFDWLLFTETF